MTKRYDLVVVGGGTAGCVVAARASEDPARRVLLIEAGPDPQPLPEVVADPNRQTELILQSPYVRMYDAERPDGSSFPLLSGRIMGGSSSINNLAFVRPMRRDFDAWQAFAGATWSYDALLPLMKAIETDPDFADSPLHGSSGPMHLDRAFKLDGPVDPPIRALMEAAHAAGLPDCPDMNVADPFGICSSPYSLIDGKRLSTSVAYLDPARGRSNLVIRSDTTVRRLIVEASRIRGVEVGEAGSGEMIEANEVVLAAGTYHSPQLLMLSGIGSETALSPLGIPVRHRLDGVGENHQDHAVVYVTFAGTTELHEEYVIPKVRLLARSNEGLDHPDLHVFMRPTIRLPGVPPMLPVSLHLLEHRSCGRVSLASTDPEDLPVVDPGLLRHPDDIQALVDGIGFANRLAQHPALAEFYGELLTPASKDQWREHVMTAYDSYHHGVGTCRIGPDGDRGAVVDPTLRVHGLDNLWIADASVLPTIPHANTNVAAILVGEIAARLLAGDAGSAAATQTGSARPASSGPPAA